MGLGRDVKIIEAMAACVPVVATDVGGVRELIEDLQTGKNLVIKKNAQGKYEFSKHAERERQIDMIHTWELEDALRECER